MTQKKKDSLEQMREQATDLIKKSYPTAEQFCWDKGLSKATVSNFLAGKKDFQVSTLVKIAKALNKKLIIRLE